MFTENDLVFDLNASQTLQVFKVTPKALGCYSKNTRGEHQIWIPKSQISYKFRDKANTHIIRLSDWYVSQNGAKL